MIWMLDVDGVLRDFDRSWKFTWLEWTGERPVCNPESWEQINQAADKVGIDRQEALDYIFKTKGFDVMANAIPTPGAFSFVNYLKSRGDRVIIGTHQSTPETREGTRAWLDRTGIGPLADLVVFTGVKASILADCYIDDRIETLVDLRECYPFAVLFAPNVPWNRFLFDRPAWMGRHVVGKTVLRFDTLLDLPLTLERMDQYV